MLTADVGESTCFSIETNRSQPADAQMELWCWLLVLLARVIQGSGDVLVTINTLKTVSQTEDRFIGISVPPSAVLTPNQFSSVTINMLQGLSPSYLRVGGYESENLYFKTPSNTSGSLVFTEAQWANLNQLALDTSLNLIFSLNPRIQDQNQLLRFSDKQGFDLKWQLGYRMPNINGINLQSMRELSQEVLNLRETLDTYPQYQNTPVLGPDVGYCEDPECLIILQNFLQQVNDAIDIVILQMKPQREEKGMKSRFEVLDRLANMLGKTFKMNTVLGRLNTSSKKPFWLAEPEDIDYSGDMNDAISCTTTLGLAAQHGYQTVLLHMPQLSQPTPVYWAALLHSSLVGHALLSARVLPWNTNVTVFAQCTSTLERPGLDTEWKYEAGAMTLWGVNTVAGSTQISLLMGARLESVHLYILTQGADAKDSILLNGKPLSMVHGVLPRLSPRIRLIKRSMSVTVPGPSVFFIVLPHAHAPACLSYASEKLPDPLKKDNIPPIDTSINLKLKPLSLSGKQRIETGDSVLETGDNFKDFSVVNQGSDTFGNTFRSNVDKDVQERIIAIFKDSEKTIATEDKQNKNQLNIKQTFIKVNNVSNEEDLTDLNDLTLLNPSNSTNKGTSIEEYVSSSDIVSREKMSKSEKSDGYISSSEISVQNNKPEKQTNVNRAINVEHITEEEDPRVKRSEDYDDFKQKSTIEDQETSPLYRRVNLLRRILSKIQKSKLYQEENEDQKFQDFTPVAESTSSKNYDSTYMIQNKHKDYLYEIPPRYKNKISEEHNSGVTENKESENISYLPGEFYEILGGLKIDSSVSLMDKEESFKASDSVTKQSESQRCNESKSKLEVIKKPENTPQLDNRVVEYATEKLKQYYVRKNNTVQIPVKTDTSVDSDLEKTKNTDEKLPQTTCKEDSSENERQVKDKQRKFYQNPTIVERGDEAEQIELPLKRNKRDTNGAEKGLIDESRILTLSNVQNEGSYKKEDYSDEIELTHYLEELTNEGEQLLQSIDEEYNRNLKIPNDEKSNWQDLTTVPDSIINENTTYSSGQKKNPGEKNVTKSDYYIEKNILVDEILKPKRKYHAKDEQISKLPSLHKTNTSSLKEDEMKRKNLFFTKISLAIPTSTSQTDFTLSSEPLVPKEITVLENKTNMLQETSSKAAGVTESINNSDVYLESISSQNYKTTKPMKSFISYNKLETNNTENVIQSHSEETNSSTIMKNSSNISDFYIKIPRLPQAIKSYEVKGTDKADTVSDSFISKPTSSPSTATEITSSKKDKLYSEDKNVNSILATPTKPKLELKITPLTVPSIINLNQNLNLPRKIYEINNRINEFNNKQILTGPTKDRNPSLNQTVSNKYTERLEAIKARLQKARERLLNLTAPKVTQSLLPIKPLKMKRDTNNSNQSHLNNFYKQESKTQVGKQLGKNRFNSSINKVLFSYLEDPPERATATQKFDLIQRLKREISNEKRIENASPMSYLEQSGIAETISRRVTSSEKQAGDNETPSYFSSIRKWIVPLSNKTENILLNNMMVPVNLYGIVSDKWIKETIGESSSSQADRQPRSLRYPCVRDSFNDFESEDEASKFPRSSNIESAKTSSFGNTKDVQKMPASLPATSQRTTIPEIMFRSRRAINEDIERNELEMKALLTNEIVKERPTNDVSDRDSVFDSMLHKTLSTMVTNKTGIERMFELAKQYQKTNPSSLEVYSTKNKKHKTRKFAAEKQNEFEEENKAVEVTGDESYPSIPKTSSKNKSTSTDTILRGKSREEIVNENSTSLDTLQEKHRQTTKTIQNDRITKEDAWSDFMNKIQEFFNSITNVIKKSVM